MKMGNLGGSKLLWFVSLALLCASLANGEILEPLIQQFRARIGSKIVVSVSSFGAKGDGITDDTQAFRDAWRVACSSLSRSVLDIPAGNTYLVGPIDFAGPCQSKVTLRVSGSIIAPKDPDIWEGLNPRKWLYFHGVNHLTVDGGGVVNGMGEEWWSRSCKVNKSNTCHEGPTAITFHRCKNLKLSNLVMLNSQQMHIAFTNCEEVRASNLKVNAPVGSPNTDAIHISSSSEVRVTNSMISTGDDCISIVGNSSDIQIRNISCIAGHGISIGSLGHANSRCKVEGVLVEKAFLSNTENGLRIKTWQGGSGFAQNIKFRYVEMENVSNPIIIDQFYCDSLLPCTNQTTAVKVKNISFTHIKGTSATEEAIRFACSNSFPCKEINLEDIQLSSYSGGITTAFCWNARGSVEGLVNPPPCFSFVDSFIEQKALPGDATYSSSS